MQKSLKQAYQWWGIPTNESKSVKRAREAERLGAVPDGEKGILRISTLRALQVAGLGAWLRSESEVPRKALQVYAGKLVHILQFRRCMFSYLEVIFTAIAHGGPMVKMTAELRTELLLVEMALPLAQFNLRAQVDPVVTCSDACESGGGICVASRVSRAGKEEVEKMMEGERVEREKPLEPGKLGYEERVLVIDLFSTVGGLTNALEKAGVRWRYLLCVESDKDCRRLLRRAHPGVELPKDVRDFDESVLKRLIAKLPGITGLIIGGGSPCQGLSKLSSKRKHFKDERSGLFYEAARAFRLADKMAQQLGLWLLKMLENVVADKEDIKEMCYQLDMPAVMVDSQYLSRARRPRLFWINTGLTMEDDVEVIERPDFTQVIYRADPEPVELFLEANHEWAGGLRDPGLKFPTFTRSIPRTRPPPDPAGLGRVAKISGKRISIGTPPIPTMMTHQTWSCASWSHQSGKFWWASRRVTWRRCWKRPQLMQLKKERRKTLWHQPLETRFTQMPWRAFWTTRWRQWAWRKGRGPRRLWPGQWRFKWRHLPRLSRE